MRRLGPWGGTGGKTEPKGKIKGVQKDVRFQIKKRTLSPGNALMKGVAVAAHIAGRGGPQENHTGGRHKKEGNKNGLASENDYV